MTDLLDDDWVFGLFGAGGFGREVMPIALETLTRQGGRGTFSRISFVVTEPAASAINGVPCISEDEFLSIDCSNKLFNVAVADSHARQAIAERLLAGNARPLSLHSSRSDVFDSSSIDEGSILCAFTSITANTKVGKFFHANIQSYVAHDCIIGDYVTMAPHVTCSGNVHVRDHAYIGAGAVIRQGSQQDPLVIGEGATIGMGAVVTRSVPSGATVIGNPARILDRDPTKP